MATIWRQFWFAMVAPDDFEPKMAATIQKSSDLDEIWLSK